MKTYSLVYLLVKLYIKNEGQNNISDQYLNARLMCYIDHNVFANVSNEAITNNFQIRKLLEHNNKWMMDIYDTTDIFKVLVLFTSWSYEYGVQICSICNT